MQKIYAVKEDLTIEEYEYILGKTEPSDLAVIPYIMLDGKKEILRPECIFASMRVATFEPNNVYYSKASDVFRSGDLYHRVWFINRQLAERFVAKYSSLYALPAADIERGQEFVEASLDMTVYLIDKIRDTLTITPGTLKLDLDITRINGGGFYVEEALFTSNYGAKTTTRINASNIYNRFYTFLLSRDFPIIMTHEEDAKLLQHMYPILEQEINIEISLRPEDDEDDDDLPF